MDALSWSCRTSSAGDAAGCTLLPLIQVFLLCVCVRPKTGRSYIRLLSFSCFLNGNNITLDELPRFLWKLRLLKPPFKWFENDFMQISEPKPLFLSFFLLWFWKFFLMLFAYKRAIKDNHLVDFLFKPFVGHGNFGNFLHHHRSYTLRLWQSGDKLRPLFLWKWRNCVII